MPRIILTLSDELVLDSFAVTFTTPGIVPAVKLEVAMQESFVFAVGGSNVPSVVLSKENDTFTPATGPV